MKANSFMFSILLARPEVIKDLEVLQLDIHLVLVPHRIAIQVYIQPIM